MPAQRQHGSDALAIDPIAQQQSHWDVTDEATLARAREKCVELLHQRATGLCGRPGAGPERRHPPGMHPTAFRTHFEELPGPEFFYSAQNRARANHIAYSDVFDKALRIKFTRHLRVLDERLQ